MRSSSVSCSSSRNGSSHWNAARLATFGIPAAPASPVTFVCAIRSPAELAEIRLALFVVRPPALFRLLGVVVEAERRHAHAGNAADRLRVRIERTFGERDRCRAPLEYFLAPSVDFGIELFVRNRYVGEPHFDRFRRAIAPVEIPDLARFLLADDAGKIRRSESRIDGADLRADLAKLRLVGCNR